MDALVNTKGEIVIPPELRESLGISPGDFIHIPDQAIRKTKPSLLGCARTGRPTPDDIDQPLVERWEAEE
jgi:AbrB family looped-hinge helix DNA binding protein